MSYGFVISKETCTGCRLCEVICSFFHDKIFRPSTSRVHVFKDLSNDIGYPILCLHCKDPKCLESCPADAITKDDNTGLVSVDYNRCTKCNVCIEVCPFNAIFIHPDSGDIIKCDYCNGDPKCIKYCEIGAIKTKSSGEPKC